LLQIARFSEEGLGSMDVKTSGWIFRLAGAISDFVVSKQHHLLS
jgi:hypothetical protein